MMVLVVLAATYVVARLVPTRGHGRRPPPDAARVAMATAMTFTGVSHVVNPAPFVQHLPPSVPAREQIILGTGVLEVLFGAGLAAPSRRRREVALALAAYLLAVFPANVYVAVSGIRIEGLPGASHPWLRLPLQFVYIGWVFWAVPGTWQLARDRAGQLREAVPLPRPATRSPAAAPARPRAAGRGVA